MAEVCSGKGRGRGAWHWVSLERSGASVARAITGPSLLALFIALFSALFIVPGLTGCSEADIHVAADDIVIGAALPFTGDEATIGQNLEQALLLAIEDVNRAGGVNGRHLRLESRDSNSGSARGLDSMLDLLYNERVQYLVGPEENALATEIVPDVKGLDVFNVLPGYASPSVERARGSGAFLRLPPSPLAFGCGLAQLAHQNGIETTNAVVAQDDFNQSVASEFAAEFVDAGGKTLASITIGSEAGAYAQSYAERVANALSAGTDRTLLIANPTTASEVVTNWAVRERTGAWLLGPALHTPGFLLNIPFRSLQGTYVLSPTLSLASECEAELEDFRGPLNCSESNSEAFQAYFQERWEGDLPFPAAHFYYDAVVLIAMGLEYGAARGDFSPSASELQAYILETTSPESEVGRWRDLPSALSKLSEGKPVRYVGAAAEYNFDRFGAAKHNIFDSWRVEEQGYERVGPMQAQCLRQPK